MKMHELVEKIIANPFEYLRKTFNTHICMDYREIWGQFVLRAIFIDNPKTKDAVAQFRFDEDTDISAGDIKEIELVEE